MDRYTKLSISLLSSKQIVITELLTGSKIMYIMDDTLIGSPALAELLKKSTAEELQHLVQHIKIKVIKKVSLGYNEYLKLSL